MKHTLTVILLLITVATSAVAQTTTDRGAKAFQQCASCHSLAPGKNRTGPSLAGVIGRKAGAETGFNRYSEAIKTSEITWTEAQLDRWLRDPQKMVPGTSMRIRPITDRAIRQDIIAHLKSNNTATISGSEASGLPNLKRAQPGQQVASIRYCPDAYWVTLGTGETLLYWEFNLRFKTDSSEEGPLAGRPVIVGQGMRGDRAQIVFASPEDISAFVRRECAAS